MENLGTTALVDNQRSMLTLISDRMPSYISEMVGVVIKKPLLERIQASLIVEGDRLVKKVNKYKADGTMYLAKMKDAGLP